MVRCVIIDDEIKAIENLKWELEHNDQEVQVEAQFTDSREALEFLSTEDLEIDVVFLDIHMPGMSGLEWMAHMGLRSFEIIVISAHDEYVFETLKHQVFDYLVKPIESQALVDCIQRLKEKLSASSLTKKLEKRLARLLKEERSRDKVSFNLGHEYLFMNLADAVYFKAEGNYCEVKHANGRTFLINSILGQVIDQLDDRFYRVHNSYVVNLDSVLLYDKKEGHLEMEDGTRIPISRRRKMDFMSHIE